MRRNYVWLIEIACDYNYPVYEMMGTFGEISVSAITVDAMIVFDNSKSILDYTGGLGAWRMSTTNGGSIFKVIRGDGELRFKLTPRYNHSYEAGQGLDLIDVQDDNAIVSYDPATGYYSIKNLTNATDGTLIRITDPVARAVTVTVIPMLYGSSAPSYVTDADILAQFEFGCTKNVSFVFDPSVHGYAVQSIRVGDSVTLSSIAAPAGYTLIGWSLGDATTTQYYEFTHSINNAANTTYTIYAYYSNMPVTYTVVPLFNGNPMPNVTHDVYTMWRGAYGGEFDVKYVIQQMPGYVANNTVSLYSDASCTNMVYSASVKLGGIVNFTCYPTSTGTYPNYLPAESLGNNNTYTVKFELLDDDVSRKNYKAFAPIFTHGVYVVDYDDENYSWITFTVIDSQRVTIVSNTVWTPYELTFDLNDAELTGTVKGNAPDTVKGDFNDTVYLPSLNATANGYRFLGWAQSDDAVVAEFAAGAKINLSKSLSLYAVWEAISYTVSFDPAEHVNYTTAWTGNATIADSVTFKLDLAAGYVLNSAANAVSVNVGTVSYNAADGTYTVSDIDGNLTIGVSGVQLSSVSVTYKSGNAAFAVGTYAGLTVLNTIASPFTKPDNKFVGWKLDNTNYGVGDTFTVGSSNIVFVAQWESYLNLTVNGNASKVEKGTVYTLPAAPTAPEGKQFKAWSNGTTEYKVGDKYTVNADIVFTAAWYDLVTVTINAVAQEVIKDTVIMLPAAPTAAAGKQFKAWSDGTIEYSVGATVTASANVTITAVWSNLVTVTINDVQQVVDEGASITLPTVSVTRDGYYFSGWTDGTDTYLPGATVTATADTQLTEVWTPVVPASVEPENKGSGFLAIGIIGIVLFALVLCAGAYLVLIKKIPLKDLLSMFKVKKSAVASTDAVDESTNPDSNTDADAPADDGPTDDSSNNQID